MFGQDLPFFPQSFRQMAIRVLSKVFELALLVLLAYVFYTASFTSPYMPTWIKASSIAGDPGLIYKIVDLCVFAIGFIPLMFVVLFAFASTLARFFGHIRPHPEVRAMQVFIAATLLSAFFGLLATNKTIGGIFGAFVANDIIKLAGPDVGMILGTLFFSIFLVLFCAAAGITFGKVVRFLSVVGETIAWIVSKMIPKRDREVLVEQQDEVQLVKPTVSRKKKHVKKVHKAPSKGTKESVYEFPAPELLEKSIFASSVITREHRDTAASMEVNFAKYGIRGVVRDIHPGPIVTRYDFEPEDGQKINKIMETATDMRRAMATEQIRIALVPRTRYIGVEMVNQNRQFVYYQTLMSNPEFVESKMKIPLALGVEISGKPFYADLAKMPHILIAGRTGSGKSVFVQSIIMSIVYHSSPDECKLIIVDPKGVDFNKWKDIPHLITPIVTEAGSAVNVLKWAVAEMESRYKQLQLLESQNISDYNDLVDKYIRSGKKPKKNVPIGTSSDGEIEYEVQEVELEKMPYLVLIIDELADLMQQARKDVEACIQRITQKARAAGIHLVAATQRPDVSVITGVIKSNLPTRISFQARSYIDSMTTLGDRGAEMLLAQGDMLYSESGKQPIRVHGAFVQDKEIEKVAKFLRAQGTPDYVDGVTDAPVDISSTAMGLPPSKDEKDGDLYSQAVEIVRRDKRPTTSYIQRRLAIGYNKAAMLIEKMEANGVIVKQPSGKYEVA